MDPVLLVIALIGLCLGSFWNVVISRLPADDRSIVRPVRSACPDCGHVLSGWENIPLVSYLWLRGRCRGCDGRISPLYPIVELLVGVVVVVVYLAYPAAPLEALRWGVFLLLLLAIAVTDARTYLIPDVYTVGGGLVAVGLSAGLEGLPAAARALGDGLVAGAVLWLLGRYMRWRVGKEALGFGDVLLIGMMAAFLGFGPALTSLWLATAPALALYLLHHRKAHDEGHVPFGLHLALGAAAVTVLLHLAPVPVITGPLARYGDLLNGLLPWY